MQQHVFISYSHNDKEVAEHLVHDLKMAGIDVWIDTQRLKEGENNWKALTEQAILNSACIIVLISPASKESKMVQDEISQAQMLRKTIIPVLIKGYMRENLIPSLANLQWIILRDDAYAAGIRELVKEIYHWTTDSISSELIELKKKETETAIQVFDRANRLRVVAVVISVIVGFSVLIAGILGSTLILDVTILQYSQVLFPLLSIVLGIGISIFQLNAYRQFVAKRRDEALKRMDDELKTFDQEIEKRVEALFPEKTRS